MPSININALHVASGLKGISMEEAAEALLANASLRDSLMALLNTHILSTNHLGEGNRVVFGNRITAAGANLLPAYRDSAKRVTVAMHFRRKGKPLKYPNAPCLTVQGGGEHLDYFPLECIDVEFSTIDSFLGAFRERIGTLGLGFGGENRATPRPILGRGEFQSPIRGYTPRPSPERPNIFSSIRYGRNPPTSRSSSEESNRPGTSAARNFSFLVNLGIILLIFAMLISSVNGSEYFSFSCSAKNIFMERNLEDEILGSPPREDYGQVMEAVGGQQVVLEAGGAHGAIDFSVPPPQRYQQAPAFDPSAPPPWMNQLIGAIQSATRAAPNELPQQLPRQNNSLAVRAYSPTRAAMEPLTDNDDKRSSQERRAPKTREYRRQRHNDYSRSPLRSGPATSRGQQNSGETNNIFSFADTTQALTRAASATRECSITLRQQAPGISIMLQHTADALTHLKSNFLKNGHF